MFRSLHSAQSLKHFRCSEVLKVAKPQNIFNLFFKVVEPYSQVRGKGEFIMAVSGWDLPLVWLEQEQVIEGYVAFKSP